MEKYKEAIFEFEDANGMIQYFEGKDKEDATISFSRSFPKSKIINVKLHQVVRYN